LDWAQNLQIWCEDFYISHEILSFFYSINKQLLSFDFFCVRFQQIFQRCVRIFPQQLLGIYFSIFFRHNFCHTSGCHSTFVNSGTIWILPDCTNNINEFFHTMSFCLQDVSPTVILPTMMFRLRRFAYYRWRRRRLYCLPNLT